MADPSTYNKLLDNFSSLTLQTQNDEDLEYVCNYINDKFDSNNYAVYTHNLYLVKDYMYVSSNYHENDFHKLISMKLEHILWLLQNNEPTHYDQMAIDGVEHFIKIAIEEKRKLESVNSDVINQINWLKKRIEVIYNACLLRVILI